MIHKNNFYQVCMYADCESDAKPLTPTTFRDLNQNSTSRGQSLHPHKSRCLSQTCRRLLPPTQLVFGSPRSASLSAQWNGLCQTGMTAFQRIVDGRACHVHEIPYMNTEVCAFRQFTARLPLQHQKRFGTA